MRTDEFFSQDRHARGSLSTRLMTHLCGIGTIESTVVH